MTVSLESSGLGTSTEQELDVSSAMEKKKQKSADWSKLEQNFLSTFNLHPSMHDP